MCSWHNWTRDVAQLGEWWHNCGGTTGEANRSFATCQPVLPPCHVFGTWHNWVATVMSNELIPDEVETFRTAKYRGYYCPNGEWIQLLRAWLGGGGLWGKGRAGGLAPRAHARETATESRLSGPGGGLALRARTNSARSRRPGCLRYLSGHGRFIFSFPGSRRSASFRRVVGERIRHGDRHYESI